MGISLTDNRCLNINDRVFARTFLHLVDGNCDSMRNLRIEGMKCFLADNFSHNLTLRLIGNGIFVIEHRTVRQIFENTVYNISCILASKGRAGNDLCKITDLAVRIDCRKDFFFFHRIDLIDDQDNRYSYRLKLFCNMALPSPDKCRRLYQPHDSVYFLQSSLSHCHHIFTQLIFCLVDSRGVQEYDLALITGIDSLDAVSGSLWFLGCNGNLLSDEMIHQGRLSNIRASDDRNKSRFKILSHNFFYPFLAGCPERV